MLRATIVYFFQPCWERLLSNPRAVRYQIPYDVLFFICIFFPFGYLGKKIFLFIYIPIIMFLKTTTNLQGLEHLSMHTLHCGNTQNPTTQKRKKIILNDNKLRLLVGINFEKPWGCGITPSLLLLLGPLWLEMVETVRVAAMGNIDLLKN